LNGSVFRLATPGVASTVSAASFSGSSIAAGSLVVGLGSGFANSTETLSEGQGAMMLGGAAVSIMDSFGTPHRATIFKVSPTEIYHDIPATTGLGKATIVYANMRTGEVSTSNIEVSPVSPGLMSADGSGTWIADASVERLRPGARWIIEPVFEKVGSEVVPIPIDVASNRGAVFLNIAGTGFRFNSGFSNVRVTVGGTPVSVVYAGALGAGIGPDRLFVLLPPSLAGRGLVDVVMAIDGRTANTVKLSIK
jgi:uncharacterized protein (TIGR03437 family)